RTIDSASAGIAVPPDDPDAFTAALVELLDDPKRRREAGASGRSFVEEWISPAGVAEAYESLFSEVSTAHRRRRR
ncbi:MAG: glycosyltransferase, partial [Actinomycetota bacterium]